MKIAILGAAAYEGYPNPFCECVNCTEEREKGKGRFRSAALVNDDLLIDFGPDLVASCQKLKLNLFNVRTLLITHSHEDHLYLPNLGMRKKGFNGSFSELPEMEIVCTRDVKEIIENSEYFEGSKSILRPVEEFEGLDSNGYSIISFPANHRVGENYGRIYLVSACGKTLFYATDTGPINQDSLEKLKGELNGKIDLLLMDATMGFTKTEYPYHNNFYTFNKTVEIFREKELLAEDAKIVAHHFSHHGNPSQEKLEESYGANDIAVAYDGFAIEI